MLKRRTATDNEIIRGLLGGQPWARSVVEDWLHAFSALPSVREGLRKRGSNPIEFADACVSKVWEVLNKGGFRAEASLRTYVFSIAKNTLLNFRETEDHSKGKDPRVRSPKQITYTGSAIDEADQPIRDGKYDLRFELYDSPDGRTLRFSETHIGIKVESARFTVRLGSITKLPSIYKGQFFVETTVIAGPEASSPFRCGPRVRLEENSTGHDYSFHSLDSEGTEDVPEPEDLERKMEAEDCTENVLRKLGKDCRKLVKSHFAGYGYKEIAVTLHTTEQAVKQRAFQCMKQARKIGRELGCLD